MSSDFPPHPIHAAVARHLERHQMAAVMADHEMRVVWFSSEFERIMGGRLDHWYGRHYAEFCLSEELIARSTRGSVVRAGADLLPTLIQRTPGGREAMRQILTTLLGPEASSYVDGVPDRADPLWTTSVMFSSADETAAVKTSGLTAEIHDEQGRFLGVTAVFFAQLPFRLVSLLARGDEDALERMARVAAPGRRSAAILFADLQSSGLLSRRLPSAVYFRLIRSLITAIDKVVIDHGGIVGRHAGDGVTAFFLTDDLGSMSSAARAAVEAGRQIRAVAAEATAEVEGETDGLISSKDCPINVGLHWGGSLYMGQLNTGGRLEVTALGDAVNECARIQETARDGQILASKTLLENLEPSDASALEVDPDNLSYASVAEIPTASDKAVRDAGGVAVASL
jgi:class 3 adenylate cyclase